LALICSTCCLMLNALFNSSQFTRLHVLTLLVPRRRARAWQTVCGVGIWECGGGASCGMQRGMRKLRHLDLGSWILRTGTWNVEMYGSCRCIYVIVWLIILYRLYTIVVLPRDDIRPDQGQVGLRSTGINSGGTGGTNWWWLVVLIWGKLDHGGADDDDVAPTLTPPTAWRHSSRVAIGTANAICSVRTRPTLYVMGIELLCTQPLSFCGFKSASQTSLWNFQWTFF